MSDPSTHDDPLDLRDDRPDYVEDKSGSGNEDGADLSEEVQPSADTDPQDPGSLGVHKPTVHVDTDDAERGM